MSNDIASLLDARDITTTIDAIVAAADRKDWGDGERFFAREVEVQVGPPGSRPATMTPRALLQQWSGVLGAFDVTLHAVTNHRITVQGDRAACVSNVLGFHRAASVVSGENYCLTFGTFEHSLARTAEGWRVTSLAYHQIYALGNPSLFPRH
jgi:hypothetical protein